MKQLYCKICEKFLDEIEECIDDMYSTIRLEYDSKKKKYVESYRNDNSVSPVYLRCSECMNEITIPKKYWDETEYLK